MLYPFKIAPFYLNRGTLETQYSALIQMHGDNGEHFRLGGKPVGRLFWVQGWEVDVTSNHSMQPTACSSWSVPTHSSGGPERQFLSEAMWAQTQ